AHAAGAIVLGHYERGAASGIEVTAKEDGSPLTRADRESNALIVERLWALTPKVPVIAEESGIPPYEVRRDWPTFWLVDPLDGTKEFLKRNGEFTVNIALIEAGEPVLGVLLAPALGRLYAARKGEGAWRHEAKAPAQRIHSRVPEADQPLVLVTSRSHQGAGIERMLPGRRIGEERHVGSALKFGLLAEGEADVYAREGPTMEWDVAAGDCIFRNSARQGQRTSPLRYNKPTLENEGFVIGLEP
ncbi:MAG: 3'(2'),5'-bisphosphate nucleotidase CysQ, partial [Planctomycetota bacterium]